MSIFLAVYSVLALSFFVFYEVLSVISNRKKNSLFIYPVFSTNHTRIVVWSIFFPVALLIVAIQVITETILDRSGR